MAASMSAIRFSSFVINLNTNTKSGVYYRVGQKTEFPYFSLLRCLITLNIIYEKNNTYIDTLIIIFTNKNK